MPSETGARTALKKQNLQPVAEASYVPSDADISALVVALKQADPDAVILGIISKHDVRSAGPRPPFAASQEGQVAPPVDELFKSSTFCRLLPCYTHRLIEFDTMRIIFLNAHDEDRLFQESE